MKIIMLTVCTLLCTLCCGQSLIMDIIDPNRSNMALQSGVGTKGNLFDVYLTDWVMGYIYYGSKKEDKKLRYNAYKDVVHIMNAQGQEIVIEKGQVEAFSLVDKDKEYKFKLITDIPKVGFGYVQVIYEGKVKVYYRHSRKEKKSISGTEGYASNKPEDQFIEDNAFVIELPNSKKYLTRARKKDIIAIFSDRKKEIEEYIKTKKLDTQKLQDLMEVVQQYEAYLN